MPEVEQEFDDTDMTLDEFEWRMERAIPVDVSSFPLVAFVEAAENTSGGTVVRPWAGMLVASDGEDLANVG